jgi:hypothetical protein
MKTRNMRWVGRKGKIKIDIIFRAVVNMRMSKRIPYMEKIFSNS